LKSKLLLKTPDILYNLHLYSLHFIFAKVIEGLVHPKMKILSVFTHPHVVPNLYVFICSAEHKGRYLEDIFPTTVVNGE